MTKPSWKWFFEAPLAPAWRRRLELSLGVVMSAAAVVALSSSIRPDPSKLVRGAPLQSSAVAQTTEPPAPPSPPSIYEFSEAVRAGDTRAMAKAYTPGMPLHGMLSLAAGSGKKAAVVWLLDHGADVHEGEGSPFGPVLAADEHPDIVALLHERGAKDPSLEAAASANAVNAVFRILETHPNLNEKDSYPLQAAAHSVAGTPANKWRIVTTLLAHGADPNREWSRNTALGGVVADCDRTGAEDCMPVVQMLLDHGARVTGDALGAALSLDDAKRAAPLDALLAAPIDKGVAAGALAHATRADPSDLKRVLANGIDWAWRDGEEDAALPVLAAVHNGDRDYVRALLDAGAPVDMHYKDATCALAEAIDASANNAEQARIVELLVSRGANVNRRFPDGRTPLFAAAESGNLRVVNFLLARGARVNDRVLDDMPLDAADQNGHIAVARVLHAHGAHRARPQYYPSGG
ncbi:MAG: ankyrin repeat domain-containing protein [Labilithrix sp.]|nr:ankyrin repeat domain-containing protein [Labilithrix sp.]MCW5809418.1 ankyrin repeat domain-containing protein [Labilithrix sp.]